MYIYKFEAFTTPCELQLECNCETSANLLADDILFHAKQLEKNDLKQVSIIASTTIDAGVWSTALLANPELQLPNHIKIVSKVL